MRNEAGLLTIAFDADDTLWGHANYYHDAEVRLTSLLSGYLQPESIYSELRRIELKNLPLYGFGVKGFTLSMIETAISVSEGRAGEDLISNIINIGQTLLCHPIELLPSVRDTLEVISAHFNTVIITRGDLFDQERKIQLSGISDLFDAIEIVSDKSVSTYSRVFARHAGTPDRAMMVGNSLRSDILPAIEAGSWGVHVPQPITWALEHADLPDDRPRFRAIANMGELVTLIESLS